AVYPNRFFAVDGGLISYGIDSIDIYRPSGGVCRSHLQGCQGGRASSTGADEIRAGDQFQSRQGAGPRRAANSARPCRRGDRMMGWMAPLRHLSAKLLSDRIGSEWEPSMGEVTTIGLDLAKHVFQVHGVDAE